MAAITVCVAFVFPQHIYAQATADSVKKVQQTAQPKTGKTAKKSKGRTEKVVAKTPPPKPPQPPKPIVGLGYEEVAKYVTLSKSKLKIAYLEVGQANQTILFLHDVDANLLSWGPVAKKFSKNAHCYLMDLPGHGLSSKVLMAGGLQQWVDVIGQFLDANDIWNVSIVAQGIGCQLATLFATQNPSRVDKLVLMAPKGFLKPDATQMANVLAKYEAKPMLIKTDSVIKTEILKLASQPSDNLKPLIRSQIAMKGLPSFGYYVTAVRNLLLASFGQPLLNKSLKPATESLLIAGALDANLNVDAGTGTSGTPPDVYLIGVRACFTNAKVALVPGTLRFPQIEDPNETYNLMAPFLLISK